jgi:hypothetical protein
MDKKWRFEEECDNEIVIYRGGARAAQIINEADVTSDEDRDNAAFIVDACNKAEG